MYVNKIYESVFSSACLKLAIRQNFFFLSPEKLLGDQCQSLLISRTGKTGEGKTTGRSS